MARGTVFWRTWRGAFAQGLRYACQDRVYRTLALGALGLPFGAGLDRGRRIWIFPRDFAIGRAGLFLGAKGVQRLAEAQEGFRRARRIGVLGRYLQILLRRLGMPAALVKAFAEIIDRVGSLFVLGILFKKPGKALFRVFICSLFEIA